MNKEELDKVYAVCKTVFGEDFITNNRCRINAERRMIFARIARVTTEATLQEIATYLQRDHATVIYSITRADELCSIYPDIEQQYKRILRLINAAQEEVALTSFALEGFRIE